VSLLSYVIFYVVAGRLLDRLGTRLGFPADPARLLRCIDLALDLRLSFLSWHAGIPRGR
jgi:hypothetical protein